MCIAGVFGGLDSGSTEDTKDIFLESAYFHPTWVRKTARRHGLNTDASFRFERGVDPNITLYCLKLAAIMVKRTCRRYYIFRYKGCVCCSCPRLPGGTFL